MLSLEKKFKYLNGGWFSFKKEGEIKEKGKVIKRGSVVALDAASKRQFIVIAVFQKARSKWHMSQCKDDPAWLINSTRA